MKSRLIYLLFILTSFYFFSCEDEAEIELIEVPDNFTLENYKDEAVKNNLSIDWKDQGNIQIDLKYFHYFNANLQIETHLNRENFSDSYKYFILKDEQGDFFILRSHGHINSQSDIPWSESFLGNSSLYDLHGNLKYIIDYTTGEVRLVEIDKLIKNFEQIDKRGESKSRVPPCHESTNILVAIYTDKFKDWYKLTSYGWVFVDTQYLGREVDYEYVTVSCQTDYNDQVYMTQKIAQYMYPKSFASISNSDLWEQEICQKENFANNDCLQEIWQVMKDLDVGYETLERFLGDEPVAELCIDVIPLSEGANGNAGISGTSQSARIDININAYKLNRSMLSIAKTLMHEMIHADLHAMVIEAGMYEHLQQFSQDYDGEDDFKIIWEYYEKYGQFIKDQNTGWQHEYMADNYIQYMADGLAKLHPYLSSPAFIVYGNSISDFRGDDFSWNKLFTYMAWEGLHETEEFQDKIVSKGLEGIFYDYIVFSNQEGSSNKCQ